MSLPKSLLLNHSCMYAKRGGVAAYHIVRIGLCLMSVPGVRVLASTVDESSTVLARYKCNHKQNLFHVNTSYGRVIH